MYAKENILYIQDSGVGIKKTKNIFKRNYTEQISGHGIGLDTVKRLCDSMDINISVSSVVGEGTLIVIRF